MSLEQSETIETILLIFSIKSGVSFKYEGCRLDIGLRK